MPFLNCFLLKIFLLLHDLHLLKIHITFWNIYKFRPRFTYLQWLYFIIINFIKFNICKPFNIFLLILFPLPFDLLCILPLGYRTWSLAIACCLSKSKYIWYWLTYTFFYSMLCSFLMGDMIASTFPSFSPWSCAICHPSIFGQC